MKRRTRKQRQPTNIEPPWFDVSSGNQLFIWRCCPHRCPLLLAGNAKGYKHLIKQLDLLNKGNRFVEMALTVPQSGPPIQWAPSSLNKKTVASIQEIESDLRKRVGNFDRFVWYRYLKLVLEQDCYEATSTLTGNRVVVTLSQSHITAWTSSLNEATFPAWGGERLAEGATELWLSGDWLGAE